MVSKFKYDLVIAYYKENLDWLTDLDVKYKNAINKVYIYCKGDLPPPTTYPHVEIQMPNMGRCDHTYLYHIVKQYKNLAPVTLFTTGSTDSVAKRLKKFEQTIERMYQTHDSVFYAYQTKNGQTVAKESYNFVMENYGASDSSNKSAIVTTKCELASPRPFGKWYKKHFPHVRIYNWVTRAVFAVSAKHIHQHPQSYYEKLVAEFPKGGSNPEVGHYFERSWLAVFHPIPKTCISKWRWNETIKKKYLKRITRKQKKPLP